MYVHHVHRQAKRFCCSDVATLKARRPPIPFAPRQSLATSTPVGRIRTVLHLNILGHAQPTWLVFRPLSTVTLSRSTPSSRGDGGLATTAHQDGDNPLWSQ